MTGRSGALGCSDVAAALSGWQRIIGRYRASRHCVGLIGMAGDDVSDVDFLAGWLRAKQEVGERRRLLEPCARDGLRFAFYGRMSTSEFQDRASSRLWQVEMATLTIAGAGEIVASFFDVGSRRRGWANRPEAARLLAEIARPDRGFDAIVVGEYERAFCGRQFDELAPLLQRFGVGIWLPEVAGPMDLDDPEQRRYMRVLGAQSQREVVRARNRALQAMKAQALLGRYLGGRPPYGYRLVDAGRHPNRRHAQWGRRATVLAPDPVTAPQVKWIFARRLEGCSSAGIARLLNERGVPCPSAVDRDRNRHRSGLAWTVQTVATILENPRYTGHEVWNRVANDRDQVNMATGRPGQRPNLPAEWAISSELAHTPLVSARDFAAAQDLRVRPDAVDHRGEYALVGLVQCGVCGRRMDSHWVHGRAGYRCRHGVTSASKRPADAPKWLYWREDRLLERVATMPAFADFRGFGDREMVADRMRATGKLLWCDAADAVLVDGEPQHSHRGRRRNVA